MKYVGMFDDSWPTDSELDRFLYSSEPNWEEVQYVQDDDDLENGQDDEIENIEWYPGVYLHELLNKDVFYSIYLDRSATGTES